MSPDPLYPVLGQLRAGQMNESQRQAVSGLMLTVGVANRYKSGELSEGQARQQMQTVIETGRVPDARALKALTDALNGDQNSMETARLNSLLDTTTQAVDALATPFVSSPPGAAALGLAIQFAPGFLKYTQDPDNILTGRFLPPRPDPILTAGNMAFTHIGRIFDQHQELDAIYKAVFPDLSVELGLGVPDSLQRLVNGLRGNVGEAAQRLVGRLSADVDVTDALHAFETSLNQRLDEGDVAVKDLLTIARQEQFDRKQREADAEKMAEAQKRHQYIQAEINGGVQLLDFGLSQVFGLGVAKKATGCLNAALSIQRLLASGAGPLAVVGGIASIVAGALGLFSEGPDPTTVRLDQIDRRLENLEVMIREGLKHLDQKLDALHTLSTTTLREVLQSRTLTTARLVELNNKIDTLTSLSVSHARDDTARDLYLTIEEFSLLASDNQPLKDFAYEKLPLLGGHLTRYAYSPHMNGRLDPWTPAQFRGFMGSCTDIRRAFGNLDGAASYSCDSLRLPTENVPDVSHWTIAVQTMLEMLVLAPDLPAASTAKRLEEAWGGGHRARESILAATCPAVLFRLLDRLERTFLRERSNADVQETLDEIVATSLRSPFAVAQHGLNFQQLFNDLLASMTVRLEPFLDDALVFNFLMSTLLWRVSDPGDALSIRPENARGPARSTDQLANELANALPRRPQLVRQDGPNLYIIDDVREELVKAWRTSLAERFDQLRTSIRTHADVPAVRDLDYSLQGVFVVAQSRGKDLPLRIPPRYRVPPARKPETFWEVDLAVFGQELLELCANADMAFAGYAGDRVDDKGGLRTMNNAPLGMPGVVLPADAHGNIAGRLTHAMLLLPKPSNWKRLQEEFDEYAAFLLGATPGSRQYPDRFVPRYVATQERAGSDGHRMAYFTRTPKPGDFPYELALVGCNRPSAGNTFGPGFTVCTLKLWIFNRSSGGIRRD